MAITAVTRHHQQGPAVITVDPSIKYQTIQGWGASASWSEDIALTVPRDLKDTLLDDAVDQLGLTRLRHFVSTYRHAWEPLNDNSDPKVTDLAKFDTSYHDLIATDMLLPFKERLAVGDPFELYLSDSYSTVTGIPRWLVDSPAEYAENIVSVVAYFRDRYGLAPQYYVIQNEPTNASPHATPEFHSAIVKVAGPWLAQRGLQTKFQYADGIDAKLTWDYVKAIEDARDVWPHIGLLSYHLYGKSDPFREQISKFGQAHGIPIAQTETMNASIATLFEDLVRGGVSYWEAAFGFTFFGETSDRGVLYSINPALTSFVRHPSYWSFRQVMHYVRPGSVRVGATSDHGDVRTAAFLANGEITLALQNADVSREITIVGLPPGSYRMSQSVADGPPTELGTNRVEGTEDVKLLLPADTVLTMYHASENQSPVWVTWQAEPSMLYLPQQATTVSVVSTDPEGDALSYRWSVVRQPEGATATIAAAQTSTTAVTALTQPGEYVLEVQIDDGRHVLRRRVIIRVATENLPPLVLEMENRDPSYLGLPTNRTRLRAWGLDPENDALTYRWRVRNMPDGAAVRLETPDKDSAWAAGLSKAGTYEFELTVSDGHHPVTRTLTVQVHPWNLWPPR